MRLRAAAVQYRLHSIRNFDEFALQVENHMKTAQEFSAEFVLFPEFLTTQLLSIPHGLQEPTPTINDLPRFTDKYLELFTSLATKMKMHIIGGTHVIRKGDRLYNSAFLFYPDGRISEQSKLHVTPTEGKEWVLSGGDQFGVFETAKGRVAVITCYDIEFPEIVRMAKARGADVIFCPSCTDDQHGFYRVRYTAHARAVENQVYVVTTGTVGSLPTVDFMRANYGQAAIISPNDIPFPPRGILAEGEINEEMIVVADLDLDLLEDVRENGSVTNWRDRRTDLYPDWK